ncbi:MAG: GLPGLI family protein [Hydrotalea sp.]|jgi:GLPGLI family protein|nr:GLPGLI family protein [Hydrotalea sp.]
MKKYKYFILITLLVPIISSSQETIQILYQFLHVRDTMQRINPYKERMLLQTTKQKSLYRSYELYLFDSLVESNEDQAFLKLPKATSEQILIDFSLDEIIQIRPFLGDTFAIKNSLDKINWTLIDSSKLIGELDCFKAIGHFKGRNYECWYAPSIAIRSGPWKLNGLPGLIVQAVDSKSEIAFELISLKVLPNTFSLPKNLTFINESKYKDIVNSFKANPGAILGGGLDQNKLNIQKGGNNKIIFNNPIELH